MRDPPAHVTYGGLWCMWGVDMGTGFGVVLVLGVRGCAVQGVGAFVGRRSRGVGSSAAGGAGLWHCRSVGI